MTIAELIDILKSYPPGLQVAYAKYSDSCLLEAREITTFTACEPRPDGWIQAKRPDKPTQTYLLLPGN